MAADLRSCRALVFDLMGTCCDWHSSVLPVLQSAPPLPHLPTADLPDLAAAWRAGFFAEIHQRFQHGLPPEDIDTTHRRVLDALLAAHNVFPVDWDDAVRARLVAAWHRQTAWSDAVAALHRLRDKFFVVVLANGTTRLQLDIVSSSGLPFHTLFSSQLLGLTKPDPAIYRKAAELMGLRTDECVMVAAHLYDLRAAREVGMRTVYVQRTTEDLDEDMEAVRAEVDLFVDGTTGDEAGGLGRLADFLGV